MPIFTFGAFVQKCAEDDTYHNPPSPVLPMYYHTTLK